MSKKVRSRLKHISWEYHRQHRSRASLHITAALNKPLKFLQNLWTEIQPHWEAVAGSEEFQAKRTFPFSLTVSTAYTANISLRSTPLLHHCSCNHHLSPYCRNTYFLYQHLRLNTFYFLSSAWENKTNQHTQTSIQLAIKFSKLPSLLVLFQRSQSWRV